MNNAEKTKLVFFGSSEFSIYVLEELKVHNILPSLIITTPDKPQGRKLILTPNILKIWAQENNIEVIDPVSLKNNPDLVNNLKSRENELFLVASYGKIIPKDIFEIPPHQTLNIHPSLLPKYRGASPIQSQILNGDMEIGVSIMQIEEAMDTGPVLIQKKTPPTPPLNQGREGRKELEKKLAIEGTRLFVHILSEWLQGAINPIIQNEDEATYCKKITKADGEINLADDPLKNLLKIKAFEEWPTAYYFLNNKRIIITDAVIEDPSNSSGQARLKILRVIPEGKKEMSYEDFLRGQR